MAGDTGSPLHGLMWNHVGAKAVPRRPLSLHTKPATQRPERTFFIAPFSGGNFESIAIRLHCVILYYIRLY